VLARLAFEAATAVDERTLVIALLDYGAGNVGSVLKAVQYLGFPSQVVSSPEVLESADKIILPGQGHFGSMLKALEERHLHDVLRSKIAAGTPYLGICLGLQALYEASEEAPGVAGLGLLRGAVTRFRMLPKVPQIGWNQLQIRNGGKGLFKSVADGSFAYYCHSYYGPVVPEAVAVTEYGETYATGIEKENVWAVQFHPEKSGEVGLKVLKNFLEL
jgi:glutamine amidotransferase